MFSHVGFYKRPREHATSVAKSDEVVADFMRHHNADIIVWVNPTSPLQTGDEVRACVSYFIEKGFDTLITVKNEQVHCLYDGTPFNYKEGETFAQTQDLKAVQPFVYSLMMWKKKTFMAHYEKNGFVPKPCRKGT